MDAVSGQIYTLPVMPITDQNGKKIDGFTVPWYRLNQEIEGSNPGDFYRLCIPPTDGRFYYPAEKRRNQENHDAMRAAEHNLDAFWRKVDSNLEVKRHARSFDAASVRPPTGALGRT